jgi:hypothetical protein
MRGPPALGVERRARIGENFSDRRLRGCAIPRGRGERPVTPRIVEAA